MPEAFQGDCSGGQISIAWYIGLCRAVLAFLYPIKWDAFREVPIIRILVFGHEENRCILDRQIFLVAQGSSKVVVLGLETPTRSPCSPWKWRLSVSCAPTLWLAVSTFQLSAQLCWNWTCFPLQPTPSIVVSICFSIIPIYNPNIYPILM